jgi:hypothetical protein
MNTDRCHDYGGCDFLDKCFGGPDAEGLYRGKTERVFSTTTEDNANGA